MPLHQATLPYEFRLAVCCYATSLVEMQGISVMPSLYVCFRIQGPLWAVKTQAKDETNPKMFSFFEANLQTFTI